MDKFTNRKSLLAGLMPTLILITACGGTHVKKANIVKKASVYTHDVIRTSELAEDAYQESRWSDAALLYQQLTKSVPSDAYVWFRLANTYVQKGDYRQAIEAYETSIERDGLQPKPWFNLSTTYLLNAKSAMLSAWDNLRADDPARDLIMNRVTVLDTLLNKEMEQLRVAR